MTRDLLFHETDIEKIRELLMNGNSPNIRDEHNRTPIFYTKTPQTMKLFLDYGADLEVVDKFGQTPMSYNSNLSRIMFDHWFMRKMYTGM